MVIGGHALAGAADWGDAMKRLLLALPLICLPACNNEPEVKLENASVGEAAQEMRKTAGDAFINPGKWEQTVSLVEIQAPGMPDEVRASMRQAMGQAQVHHVCLTKEQARSPKEDFFTGADKSCRYEHFNWGDGKIDLKLDCKHPQATQTMAMIGSYSPESYTMTMTATNVGGGPAGEMTMKMKVEAKRIGDCDGDEQVSVGN